MSNKPTILVTHTTDPVPPHISGEALEAIQAADRHAETVSGNLRAAAKRLTDAINAEEVTASLLAEAHTALAAYREAMHEVASVAPRHRIRAHDLRPWRELEEPANPATAVYAMSDTYRDMLLNAGVSIPVAGVYSARYWHDAAARGC